LQKQSEKESETGKEFAIWAIDLRLIRYARRSGHGSNVRLPEINVPRAKNPFLHAQHGLFIVDMDANGSWENGSSIPLDQVIGKFADWCKGRKGFWSPEEIPNKLLPPVPKIEVPVALAGDVLRILRNEGITLGHLMPNYDGVVSSIKLMRELAG
jgi:hypothetical protein